MAQILILEDDDIFANLLCEALTQAGHDPRWFRTTEEAFEDLYDTPSPLAIVDIIIKKDGRPQSAGGVLFMHRAKDWARTTDNPLRIIAISGSVILPGMENVLTLAKQVGADSALAKPFSPDALMSVVDKQLELMGAS